MKPQRGKFAYKEHFNLTDQNDSNHWQKHLREQSFELKRTCMIQK